MFNLPSTGCDEFSRITIAANFAIIFYSLAIICSLMALLLVVIFYTCRPTLLSRKGIFAMQMGGLLFSSFAIFFFGVIGGSLRSNVFLGGLFILGGGAQLHETNFSYGGGMVVGLLSAVWAWSLPFWSLWAVKLKYCEDFYSEEDERDEEAAELMSDIRREAAKLDPETAQSILHPVTAQDIISWYNPK